MTYFYLTNDSILTFFSSDLVNGSIVDEFKRNGINFFVVSKFFMNFYLLWWFVLFGFFIAVLKKLKNFKDMPLSDWLILFTILYISGISSFISFGHSRFRTAIQIFIILWSADAWLSIAKKLKLLYLSRTKNNFLNPRKNLLM